MGRGFSKQAGTSYVVCNSSKILHLICAQDERFILNCMCHIGHFCGYIKTTATKCARLQGTEQLPKGFTAQLILHGSLGSPNNRNFSRV